MTARSRLATVVTVAAAGAVVVVIAVGAALTAPIGAVAGTPTKANTAVAVPRPDLARAAGSASDPTASYVPIRPCRVVNTHMVKKGRFGNGTVHSYAVAGTGLALQGGTAGGCGIPDSATAVTASLTANNPSGHGYLRAWPYGGTEPTGGVLTYPTNTAVTSGATLAVRPGGGAALTVINHTGSTDLVIDVTGYYLQQIYALVLDNGALYSASNRIVASSRYETGGYTITVDRTADGCAPAVALRTGDDNAYIAAAFTSLDSIDVRAWDLTGTPLDVSFTIALIC